MMRNVERWIEESRTNRPVLASVDAAQDDLVSALAGVELSEEQQRIVIWLLGSEQSTPSPT